MRILLDTNILSRAADSNHAQHEHAAKAVGALTAKGDMLCLVPQNLYEFWVVCTRPADQNGLGMTVELVQTRVGELKQAFELLEETPAFRPEWEALVSQHKVKGKSAHDARLVAAMKVHGLTTLLTFNRADFARYSDLAITTPEEVMIQATSSPAAEGSPSASAEELE